mgnify:FL=1|jgi:TolA-binding protein
MELKELLGEELYAQVEAKITEANAGKEDKLQHIRYADLSEGNYVGKKKYETLEVEKGNLETQIATLNKTIAELKKNNSDNEELQKTIETLNANMATLKQENEKTAKTFALTQALQKAGVLDAEYLIYKAGGIDKFNFDKEGKPIGVDDVLTPYKADETMAHLFKQEPKKPPYNPKGGNGGSGVNPFAKETFNLTKQGEMLKNNPEQAKAMAVAAGVTL